MTFHKMILFISSYIPLYILMIFKNFFERTTEEGRFINIMEKLKSAVFFDEINDYSIIILVIFCASSYIYLNLKLKQAPHEKYYVIKYISDESSNYYFNYISIYLLSCLGLSLNRIVDVFVFVFLMIIVGYIYITNNMLYMNPTLQLIGFKVYDTLVESESTSEVIDSIIIANKHLKLKSEVRVKGTGKGFFLLVNEIVPNEDN